MKAPGANERRPWRPSCRRLSSRSARRTGRRRCGGPRRLILSLSGFVRVGLDQQRGYCRNELGRRERLAEDQTVGDAFRWPIGRAVTADIDHRQIRDEFSPATGNLPAVRSSAQTDIGYKSTETRRIGFDFAQRLSALRHVTDINPASTRPSFRSCLMSPSSSTSKSVFVGVISWLSLRLKSRQLSKFPRRKLVP